MCILNTTTSQILSPLSTLLKTLPKPREFTSFLYSHLILRNYFSSSDISKSYFPEEINLLGLVSLNSLFSLDPSLTEKTAIPEFPSKGREGERQLIEMEK